MLNIRPVACPKPNIKPTTSSGPVQLKMLYSISFYSTFYGINATYKTWLSGYRDTLNIS
jgi:hypothetical protein